MNSKPTLFQVFRSRARAIALATVAVFLLAQGFGLHLHAPHPHPDGTNHSVLHGETHIDGAIQALHGGGEQDDTFDIAPSATAAKTTSLLDVNSGVLLLVLLFVAAVPFGKATRFRPIKTRSRLLSPYLFRPFLRAPPTV